MLITGKVTEMTTKRSESGKWPRLLGFTEPEYSSVRNMILLAVCHILVQNFNVISWADDFLKDNIIILNAYQVISVIIADPLIVISWNFFCMMNYSSCLILQFRTKEQFPLTSLGFCQKNLHPTSSPNLLTCWDYRIFIVL